MDEDFVRVWLEWSLKLIKNKTAFVLLQNPSEEKEKVFEDLQFPPIRESDNQAQKTKTIGQYKEVCSRYFKKIEEEKEKIQHELGILEYSTGGNLLYTYHELLNILEKITDELHELSERINEYEASSGGTFINKQELKKIQQSAGNIIRFTEEWEKNFIDISDNQQQAPKSALDELQEMVGLSDVKRRIHQYYQYLKFQKDRKRAGFKITDELSLNMVLLGNPGTGKTTIARLLAKTYHELGVLERDEVIETNRSQLVGAYMGQTEENVG